jgi:hypothetical protein
MATDGRRLFADFGSLYTRLLLLEPVEGEDRLIATVEVPAVPDTPASGEGNLAAATARLAALVGLSRPDTLRPPDVAVTSSPGLRRALVVTPDRDATWPVLERVFAPRALLPVELPIPLTETGATEAASALIDAMLAHRPVLVVFASASLRSGSEQLALLAETAVWAARTMSEVAGRQPAILFAGHPRLWDRLSATLAGRARVWQQPATRRLDEAALAQAIDQAVPEARPPLQLGAAQQVAPALQALCNGTCALAQRYDMDVLALELGAEHCAAVLVRGTDTIQAVLHGIGMGQARPALVERAGAQNILRWLPFDLSEAELRRRALNHALRPTTVPHTVEDVLIEHALAREALRLAVHELLRRLEPGKAQAGDRSEGPPLPPVDLLVVSGGVFRHAPRPVQAALIALDAVQPVRVTQLGLDRGGVLPLLGALGHDDPAALALERDGLLNLGLCLAPSGAGREGEIALHVELQRAGGQAMTVDVPYGSLEVVPFDLHERGTLKLMPGRNFDVGLGRGRGATPRGEVEGGVAGMIIDARGRPLALPAGREKRQARLIEWLQLASAYPDLPLHGTASPFGSYGGTRG